MNMRDYMRNEVVPLLENSTGRKGEFEVVTIPEGVGLNHNTTIQNVKVVSRLTVTVKINYHLLPVYTCYHNIELTPAEDPATPVTIDAMQIQEFTFELLRETGLMQFAAQVIKQLWADHLARQWV